MSDPEVAMAQEPSTAGGTTARPKLGPLIVVSGPSGSGKSTVIKRLLEESRFPLHLSTSATTRAPRPGEKNGVDYFYWKPDQFEKGIHAGSFLEWARVHGECYGTLASEVIPYRERGTGVILDIDVQGATAIRRLFPDAVTVFLRTRSMETYEERLRNRGTENEAAVRRRLAAAREELNHSGEYAFQVVNEDLKKAVDELRTIVEAQFEGR
jgi:guanylate kinase